MDPVAMKYFCGFGAQHPLGKACDCAPPAAGTTEVHERVCDRCGKLLSIQMNPLANAAAGGVGFVQAVQGAEAFAINPLANVACGGAIPAGHTWVWPDDFCQCPLDTSQDWRGLYLTGLQERKRLEQELRQVNADLSSALVREKALQEKLAASAVQAPGQTQ